MSVLASKRNQSEIQYIQTAKELQTLMFDLVTRCPKRYSVYLCEELFRLASEVHKQVRAANTIYPTNAHEVQMRKDHLIRARQALGNIDPYLELMYNLLSKNRDQYPWRESKIMAIAELIDKEFKLIAGVMQSDKERYKALTE